MKGESLGNHHQKELLWFTDTVNFSLDKPERIKKKMCYLLDLARKKDAPSVRLKCLAPWNFLCRNYWAMVWTHNIAFQFVLVVEYLVTWSVFNFYLLLVGCLALLSWQLKSVTELSICKHMKCKLRDLMQLVHLKIRDKCNLLSKLSIYPPKGCKTFQSIIPTLHLSTHTRCTSPLPWGSVASFSCLSYGVPSLPL